MTDPAATADLVAHLRGRAAEIGRLLARRYREEIVEYRSLPDGFIEQDVAAIARRNFEDVLSGLSSESPDPETHLQEFRDSAIRRFQQGVPIHALLQAYRLWGHTVWDEVLKAPQTQQNPAAALVLAGRIMKHVDQVSTTVAQAYLQKATGLIHDREIARRDLIEALVTGTAAERVTNYAATFKLDPTGRFFAILLRGRISQDPEMSTRLLAGLRAVEDHVASTGPTQFIVCIRGEEIVAVCRADHAVTDALRQSMDRLAQRVPAFVVGVGRPVDTLLAVDKSYVDAQDAILSAAPGTGRPRAYLFADALLDHVVRSSNYRADLDKEAIAPLREYDEAHGSGLLPTLRAYIDSGFSLRQAAQDQQVQPNTVKYRLQRVHALTGHDPLNPRDILLFALALVDH